MLPRPLIRRGVDLIPEPIAERLLPWKRSAFRRAGVAHVAENSRRLLIGPVNSAGQAYAWAQAAETLPGTSAMNVMLRTDEDVFDFPATQSVPTVYAITNRRWQNAQRRAVTRGFSHVLIESGRRLFGPGHDVAGDVGVCARRGLRVGLLWHGSDIRIPSVHADTSVDSPFRDGRYPEQGRLEDIARRNHALIASAAVPNFVSTPDLLAFVPDATWLPVVVDLPRWSTAAPNPPLRRQRPVVVHAPSRAGLKGTALISGLMHRLHDDGFIEYRELTGVPSRDMPRHYGEADIVLDQFSLGIYGVAACEAMAAGRVVVSHVSGQVREKVRSVTGLELPILESRASELETVLRRIIADPFAAQRTAEDGAAFVARVHDGRRSAEVLSEFLSI